MSPRAVPHVEPAQHAVSREHRILDTHPSTLLPWIPMKQWGDKGANLSNPHSGAFPWEEEQYAEYPWDAESARDARVQDGSSTQPVIDAMINKDRLSSIAGCFPELAVFLQANVGAGNVVGDVGVRASATGVVEADQFDPWSSPNNAANDYVTGLRAGSPGCDRLCLAISKDGKEWLKTGLIVMDGAGVPCLAVEDDTLYLYFNCILYSWRHTPAAGLIPSGVDTLAVATTKDLVNWTYRKVENLTATSTSPHGIDFKGVNVAPYTIPGSTITMTWEPGQPADPSVVASPNGGWYLFVTLNRRLLGSKSPYSRDTFVVRTDRLSDFTWEVANGEKRVYPDDAAQNTAIQSGVPDMGTYDPSVLWVGGHLRFFAWGALNTLPQATTKPWIEHGVNHDVTLSVDASDVFTVVAAGALEPEWSGTVEGVAIPTPYYPAGEPVYAHFANGATVGPPGSLIPHDRWFGFVQVQPERTKTPELWLKFLVSYSYNPRGPLIGSPWQIDNGGLPILVPDREYEQNYVTDPAVVKFKDCYVMVYNAQLPKAFNP